MAEYLALLFFHLFPLLKCEKSGLIDGPLVKNASTIFIFVGKL